MLAAMKIALGADENTHLVGVIAEHLEQKGHAVRRFGAAAGEAEPWGETGARVAESVARGEHEIGVVCCWTGTGVSIAANKVPGVRAALCARRGDGARRSQVERRQRARAQPAQHERTAGARDPRCLVLASPTAKSEIASLEAIQRREPTIAKREAAECRYFWGRSSRSSAR